MGDLNGILEKADYLENEVGVGSIGLSPIFKSSDYKDIDEKFGTLDDFKKLVDGIRVPATGYKGKDLDQTLALLREVRGILDADEENPKVLMTNLAPSSDISKFYGANVADQIGSLSQMPVDDKSFLPETISATNLKSSIEEYN